MNLCRTEVTWWDHVQRIRKGSEFSGEIHRGTATGSLGKKKRHFINHFLRKICLISSQLDPVNSAVTIKNQDKTCACCIKVDLVFVTMVA